MTGRLRRPFAPETRLDPCSRLGKAKRFHEIAVSPCGQIALALAIVVNRRDGNNGGISKLLVASHTVDHIKRIQLWDQRIEKNYAWFVLDCKINCFPSVLSDRYLHPTLLQPVHQFLNCNPVWFDN